MTDLSQTIVRCVIWPCKASVTSRQNYGVSLVKLKTGFKQPHVLGETPDRTKLDYLAWEKA